nr:MAG TPA: hypothetical protein [Caudoviricetes sp.]
MNKVIRHIEKHKVVEVQLLREERLFVLVETKNTK